MTFTPIRIGIPRALFYYTFSTFWETFFREIGSEIVVSQPTTREVLDAGIREAVSEACIPIKVYHGHVRALAGTADFVFAPRLVSVDRRTVFCPKFLGLPDMVRSSMDGIPPLLSPRIDLRKNLLGLASACFEVGASLKVPSSKVMLAYARACAAHKRRTIPWPPGNADGGEERTAPGSPLKIAVLGYPYAVFDRYVSVDLIRKLWALGVDVVTIEMFTDAELNEESAQFSKGVFWHYSDRVVKAGYRCFHTRRVDGVIHVTAFGCGPDAVADRLLDIEASRTGFPFMPLLIDEHTGEGGLLTRVEAFVDMISRVKGGDGA